MEILYSDNQIIVCIKPAGILSTDETGGVPELLRSQLGCDDVRTVHRLDRVVGGVMLLARSAASASELSRQIRDGEFEKRYLAVVHGNTPPCGELRDLLRRDRRECKTYVTDVPDREAREAVLCFKTLASEDDKSLVEIELLTGRTHQIRCQFSHHGFPLYGDRKYSLFDDGCDIALLSHEIAFTHPADGKRLRFTAPTPDSFPWNEIKSPSFF